MTEMNYLGLMSAEIRKAKKIPLQKLADEIESQEGTFPDACIVTCLTTALKGDKM